jgi:hypothetical protein
MDRRTLCGHPTASTKEYGSKIGFEIAKTLSEIVKAAAKDDKDNICNKCLAEFFDNVLPLKWKLMNYEAMAAAVAATTTKDLQRRRGRKKKKTHRAKALMNVRKGKKEETLVWNKEP